jgi:hypothetical protein
MSIMHERYWYRYRYYTIILKKKTKKNTSIESDSDALNFDLLPMYLPTVTHINCYRPRLLTTNLKLNTKS